MKCMRWAGVTLILGGCLAAAAQETVTISKERFLDKCRGAWAGQMIGVCYGAPYEFKSNGAIIEGPMQPWTPERVKGALRQDDVYVEMTFLMTLMEHGLDLTYEQVGKAFGESQYRLWHANRAGRDNIRAGIMPPLSGNPDFNIHADDIDFQIEADLFGIICPALPQECNRLGDLFGHIMNYGDGVYGGLFVGGMYTAAYLEDSGVSAVVAAGLRGIPEASTYHQCISDVVRWHAAEPDDWKAVWQKIEDKWQDDVDCKPGGGFNIDAKLNGAYIVMGLLYGGGDLRKTVEISTRCGQDADCNPSSALGVLGCMKGYKGLGEAWTGGIPEMEDGIFEYTTYSFKTLIPASQKMAEQVILRAGGEIKDDSYVIPVQPPLPPSTLEQWVDQKRTYKRGPIQE